ncbi:hypothetical protein [Yoonia maritima]|uniref:hypothetical protein n=1 Tax=Yoonia maritima TaxID=1435347 RepID=UPI000D1123E4|nr:hypothetical protein [Yoonia maritima]
MTANRLLIHIGHRNTDAVPLQDALFASKNALFSQDIYLPKFTTENLERFTLGFAPNEDVNLDRKIADHATGPLTSHWDKIRAPHQQSGCETIVVSNQQYFKQISTQTIDKFEDATNGIAHEKSIVAYLRAPDSHFLTLTQQRLHQMREPTIPSRTRIKERIEPLAKAWSGTITLEVFSDVTMKNGNIVDDFVSRHLPNFDLELLVRPKATKPRLSVEAMALLIDRMHGRLDETVDPTSLIHQIIKADQKLQNPTQPKLREEAAQTLNNWAAPDLAWLNENYGIRFPELDYRLIDADDVDLSLIHFTDIAQICDLNQDRKDALYHKAKVRAKLPRPVQRLLSRW